MKERITITIDPDLLEEIEEERGLVPRSKYIEKILKERKKCLKEKET